MDLHQVIDVLLLLLLPGERQAAGVGSGGPRPAGQSAPRHAEGLTSSVLRPGTDLLLSPKELPSPTKSSGRRSITDLV